MKKRGRPKLPDKDARKPRMTIRLTQSEDEEIGRAVEQSGKPKSDWIRDTLLGAARAQEASSMLSRLGGTMPDLT